MSDEVLKVAPPDLLAMTSKIVAAYVGKNAVSTSELPEVVQTVFGALQAQGAATAEPQSQERQPPAVPVKKSVHREYIVCLECGAHQKTLKRHLMTAHDLTPDAHKAKWDLPRDYPLVAPAYADTRSALAKQIRLGRYGRPDETPEQPKEGRRKRAA